MALNRASVYPTPLFNFEEKLMQTDYYIDIMDDRSLWRCKKATTSIKEAKTWLRAYYTFHQKSQTQVRIRKVITDIIYEDPIRK